jgi:hypothetical protein
MHIEEEENQMTSNVSSAIKVNGPATKDDADRFVSQLQSLSDRLSPNEKAILQAILARATGGADVSGYEVKQEISINLTLNDKFGGGGGGGGGVGPNPNPGGGGSGSGTGGSVTVGYKITF